MGTARVSSVFVFSMRRPIESYDRTMLIHRSSAVRWGIATSLQLEDFVEALRASRVAG
jgi:hypothetical protein